MPARGSRWAYVCSGTWSLAGLERRQPIVTERARAANFTNEAGVDGTTRFLRNVGGLWLLQECLRDWEGDGGGADLAEVLRAAAALPAGGPVVDADDPAFIVPDDMPRRLAAAARERCGRAPRSQAEIVRCVLDSLAAGYARTVDEACSLAATEVEVIHVVGGGSANHALCQLTADSSGRPVLAGPVEATSLGNVLVQARTAGAVPSTLDEMRSLPVVDGQVHRFAPRAHPASR